MLPLALAAEQDLGRLPATAVRRGGYRLEHFTRRETNYSPGLATTAPIENAAAVEIVLGAGGPLQILGPVVGLYAVNVIHLRLVFRVWDGGLRNQTVHSGADDATADVCGIY